MNDIPTDDDGETDGEAIIDQMFTHVPTNASPVYIQDSGETLAIIDVDTEAGIAQLCSVEVQQNPTTWDVSLEALWSDWQNGGLTFCERTFISPEEDTYDTERKVAINQCVLSTLADAAATSVINAQTDSSSQEHKQAVQTAYALLGHGDRDELTTDGDA